MRRALRALERDGIHGAGVGYLIRDEYRWKGTGAGRYYRILFRFRAPGSIRFVQVQRIERRTTTAYRH